LNRLLRCIRAVPVLAAAAIAIAGCADSRTTAANAPSNANAQVSSDQGEQPYKTSYGFTSDGPTTDLYTELFGSSRRDAAPPPTAPQPVEPVIASTTIQPVQPATTPAGKPKAQRATASAANRQVQPANAAAATQQVQPAPVTAQAVQPPAPPQPPAEADIPTAYGITSNGPTTDLYTALFGPRHRDGQ
jgi:outer membrane biosynthesis protein TonB